MSRFFTCKNNLAFKEVFMKEKNKDLLIPLLESCLGIKINDIEFLNLEDNVDYVKERRNYKIKRKFIPLVEMNFFFFFKFIFFTSFILYS